MGITGLLKKFAPVTTVIIFPSTSEKDKWVPEVMTEKLSVVQGAYWVDTKTNHHPLFHRIV
jgi:hypothetical protein